jgi:hypothetical protein
MKRAITGSAALITAAVIAVFLTGTAIARQGSDAKATGTTKGV